MTSSTEQSSTIDVVNVHTWARFTVPAAMRRFYAERPDRYRIMLSNADVDDAAEKRELVQYLLQHDDGGRIVSAEYPLSQLRERAAQVARRIAQSEG